MAPSLCFSLSLSSPFPLSLSRSSFSPPPTVAFRSPCLLPGPFSGLCRPTPLLSPASASASADGFNISSSTAVTTEIEGEILSGEWPEGFSMLNFEDLCKHYEPVIFKEEAQPHTYLADVMSKIIYTASPDQILEEVDHFFLDISGLPVINKDRKCIGVLSKKDRLKASKGLQSKVGEVMTSPPISLSADKTVKDAAVLMLKNKVHRIPIVNEASQVVGIVTRTDIFTALEGEP